MLNSKKLWVKLYQKLEIIILDLDVLAGYLQHPIKIFLKSSFDQDHIMPISINPYFLEHAAKERETKPIQQPSHA